jgi:LmbE family N-acetylglucosaminyl deacetylase
MSDPENLIQTAGTSLAAWQGSHKLANVPFIETNALIPAKGRVVVVAPHPDDEVIACGGLLAAMAMDRTPLLLISVTDGEGSHPGSIQWPPDRLRQAREKESAAALEAIGLREGAYTWKRLHRADSQVAKDEAGLVAELKALLAPGDRVFTTWAHDGHCDHEAVARACLEAAAAAGASVVEIPVWAWHWAAPEDDRLPWHRARRLPLTEAWLARKRAAIYAHHSQLQPDPSTGAEPVLSNQALQRWLQPFEVVFV